MADLATSVEDAVITEIDVRRQVTATENRAPPAAAHGAVQPDVGMDNCCPAGDPKVYQPPCDRASDPRVIDRNQELCPGMFGCGINPADHWPGLRGQP